MGQLGNVSKMSMDDDILDYVEVARATSRSEPPWRIARRLRKPLAEPSKPGVVWLGGFNSDMRGTKACFLDEWSRTEGRSCLRFDYSGHGESDGLFEDGAIGDWLEQSIQLFEHLDPGLSNRRRIFHGGMDCAVARPQPRATRGSSSAEGAGLDCARR